MSHPTANSSSFWPIYLLVGCVLVVVVALSSDPLSNLMDRRPGPGNTGMSPEQIQAARHQLNDDTLVIGVVVDGQPRAYPLRNLIRPDQHIVNELFGTTAVSVTYCDLDDCVRIFTAKEQQHLLDLRITGPDARRPRKMVLQLNEQRYWQDTGESLEAGQPVLPLKTMFYERTTLGNWRTQYPNTEVFTGETRQIAE